MEVMDVSFPPGLEPLPARVYLNSACLATSPPVRALIEDDASLLAAGERVPQHIVWENAELIRQNAELRAKLVLMTENAALAYTSKRCEDVVDRGSMRHERLQSLRQKAEISKLAHGHSKGIAAVAIPSDATSSTASSGSTSEADDISVDETASGQNEGKRESRASLRRIVSSAAADQSLRTTVMMRNIPSQYKRAELLELLDQQGFHGHYDFAYLAIDFKTELNHGYAFINFVTTDSVKKFRAHFIGFTDWSVPSDKACEIYWSDTLQGIDAHIQRYRNSPMMHESVEDRFRPVLFKHGQRIPFPEPTKTIRMPRNRR
jgi:hypothetical protein